MSLNSIRVRKDDLIQRIERNVTAPRVQTMCELGRRARRMQCEPDVIVAIAEELSEYVDGHDA